MVIKHEISSLYDFEAWSGGKDTLNAVINNGKVAELESLIADIFGDEPIDETELNDFLWFDVPDNYPELLGDDE